MKCTFSRLCYGLICCLSILSLAENTQAEDPSDTEGVVRSINTANETDGTGTAFTGGAGTAYTGSSYSESPYYSGIEVEQVFEPPRRRRRRRRLLPYAHGPKWDAYTAWGFRPGNERIMGDGQVMVPLWQNGTSMLFADIRGHRDDDGAMEGNWGLGFRRIVDDRWILGMYGFFDRRKTTNDNYFNQGTLGIEAMSVEWEARANVYFPESDSKNVGAPGGGGAAIFGGRVILRGGSSALEQALYGVDFEVGKLFYEWGPDVELRGFINAFHFDTSNQGFANVSGARARTELRIYDLNFLGEGSRLNLGGEIAWDEVRDTQATALLRIQIPLGRKQRSHTRLQRRMLDRVVRDVDIVSTEKSGTGAVEQANDVLMAGRTFGSVVVIDANTANPQLQIDTAFGNSLGGPSTVIISNRAGPVLSAATLTLNPNQNLIGSGSMVPVVGAVSGTPAILTVPGARPTISANAVNAVTVSNGSTVRGLAIDGVNGGTGGIVGATVSNVVIDNNIITGQAGHGISITGTSAVRISNNTTNFNTGNGINVGTTVPGTIALGGGIPAPQWGIFNNISNGNTNGIFATTVGTTGAGPTSIFGNSTGAFGFTNGVSNGNTANGISVGTVVAGASVNNNTSTNNGTDGFQIGTLSPDFVLGTFGGRLNNNTALANGVHGIQVDAFNFGANIFNNSSNNNVANGFLVINAPAIPPTVGPPPTPGFPGGPGNTGGNTAMGNFNNAVP